MFGIQKLSILPALSRDDDNNQYIYPEKYIGEIYIYNDKLIKFKDKSYEELPLSFIEIIYKNILKDLENKYISKINFEDNQTNINAKIESDILDKIQNEYDYATKDQLEAQTKIINNLNKKNQELELKLNDIGTSESIKLIIDDKLTDVYNNFKNTVGSLVKKEAANITKDSHRESSGKLKLSTLMMMKELGYSPNDIKDLAGTGLI